MKKLFVGLLLMTFSHLSLANAYITCWNVGRVFFETFDDNTNIIAFHYNLQKIPNEYIEKSFPYVLEYMNKPAHLQNQSTLETETTRILKDCIQKETKANM